MFFKTHQFSNVFQQKPFVCKITHFHADSASGGSEDWMKAYRKVKYSYLLELRPKDSVWGGFAMQTKFLRPIGEETWQGIKVVADAVQKFDEKRRRRFRH